MLLQRRQMLAWVGFRQMLARARRGVLLTRMVRDGDVGRGVLHTGMVHDGDVGLGIRSCLAIRPR